MMTVILTALLLQCLSPIAITMVAKSLAGFSPADNANPRAFMAKAQGMAARLAAAEQNTYEALPLLITSVLLAIYFVIPEAQIVKLVLGHVLFRVIYVGAYAANLPALRSIAWAIATACNIMLFMLVLYML